MPIDPALTTAHRPGGARPRWPDGLRWFPVPVLPGREPVAVAVEAVPMVAAVPTVGAAAGDPPAGECAHLSVDERRRYARMGPARAAEFARGRSLLRRLVAAVFGLPAGRVVIEVEPGGRLRLANHPAGVSLSHTDSHTAAAVWPGGEVGIDVAEPPVPLDPRLVHRCCGERAGALAQLPDRPRAAAFARVWAVQEACVKALGVGLSGRPWRIPVEPDAAGGSWGLVRWSARTELEPTALAVAVRPVRPTAGAEPIGVDTRSPLLEVES